MSLAIYTRANTQRLLGGQALSQICDRMTSLGLLWVVTEKGGASLVPWYLACAGLPHLLLLSSAPKAIARHGALRLVVAMDFARAFLYLIAFALLFTPMETLPLLFGLVLISNCAAAIFNPAILTLPFRMERGAELQALNGALTSCMSLANIFGPLIAIAIYSHGGLPLLFGVTALAYAWAGIMSTRISESSPAESESTENEKSPALLEAFGANPVIRTMLSTFLAMNLFLAPIQLAFPVYAKEFFGGSMQALAWLEFSMGIGMILGSLFLSFCPLPGSRLTQISSALIAGSIMYLGFALTRSLTFGLLFCGLLGFGVGLANVLILSEFQERPKPKMVPAIMALVNGISVACLPLSMAACGLLLRFTTVPKLVSTAAMALIFVTVISLFLLRSSEKENHAV